LKWFPLLDHFLTSKMTLFLALFHGQIGPFWTTFLDPFGQKGGKIKANHFRTLQKGGSKKWSKSVQNKNDPKMSLFGKIVKFMKIMKSQKS